MRYSRRMLIFKYMNRESRFGTALALSLFAVLLTAITAIYFFTDFPLLVRGRQTQAILQEKFIARNDPKNKPIAANIFAHGGRRRRGPQPQFRYQYVVDGKQFTGTARVSESQWQQAVIGQPLQIQYLPDRPEQQHLGSGLALTWSLSWGFFPMTLAIIFWTSAYNTFRAGIRNVQRQVRLICDGEPALAIVDKYEVRKTRKGRSYVSEFGYTYLVVDEKRQQHLEQVEESNDIPFLPISPGDVLLVLYDPQDVSLHTIDRFDARREDRLRLQDLADSLAAISE